MPMLRAQFKGVAEARAGLKGWNPSEFVDLVAPQAASVLTTWLRYYIAYKTGQTAKTLGAQRSGTHLQASGNLVAFYLYSGTRAHLIRARGGGMLAFPGASGETVFRREVHHPGTPGTNYPMTAWQSASPEIAYVARRAAAQLLRGGA